MTKFVIAANIAFPLPASFIWEMFVRVLPRISPKRFQQTKHELETDDAAQLLDGMSLYCCAIIDRRHRQAQTLSAFRARRRPVRSVSGLSAATGLRSEEAGKTVEEVWGRRKRQAPLWKRGGIYLPRWGSRAGIARQSLPTLLFKR